jgi:hypothetical protein
VPREIAEHEKYDAREKLRIQHKEDLRGLYRPPNIVRKIKSFIIVAEW